MLRKALIALLCVSVLLTALGSCGNTANSAIQDIKTDPQDPVGQDPSGKTSDADPSDPSDTKEDNETGTDGEDDAGNTDDEDDPGNVEDPDHGEGPDAVEQPDNGDGSGSGDQPGNDHGSNAGDGQGSDGGSGPEDQPDGGTALTGSAAVQTHLDGQEDNTATTPYRIKAGGINLAGAGAGNALKGLYFALSRFVALDLSGSYGEKFANVAPQTALNKHKITGIILPPGLYAIDVNAFVGCENLVSADLNGVTIVKNGAFSDCAKLETLLAEEVTELVDAAASGNGIFHNCDSLVSVSLPKVTEIGKKAFNSCDSLSTVYAPQATVIGDSAFASCKNLKQLILGETPPVLGDSVFVDGKPEVIYVPASAVNTYKHTDVAGWTEALKAKAQAMP